ncbi:helix-turn-helix domain-containing protein [Paenibacillus sp. HB172176]|uniref:helix-turn-helix domain-containing protein n=1 Tax=Paenibacillus sp. HB172176 TaxID=2493690 RepID=UPI00143C40AC|nr:helix-turn-helix domain-containing protein [Paenibacillus sp. HB172176]
MFNLLVVDDEEIAIRGIIEGIDWSDLPLEHIWSALDAEEAKEIFQKEHIDILLSDIDMPSENGIDLLRWVSEKSRGTVTIFLTGHAEFHYAQQAVQLSCFDYLLKPIDHERLKEVVALAIRKSEEQQRQQEIQATYLIYSELWRKQRPVLVERFWQDLLHYRLSVIPQQLNPVLANYEIPLTCSSFIQFILISIEQWKEGWSARDEEIMTYGVKNAAEELILKKHPGAAVQETNGIIYIIFYEPAEAWSPSEMEEDCKSFIEQCRQHLHVQLSCYVGGKATVDKACESFHHLLMQEKHNVIESGAVLHASEYHHTTLDKVHGGVSFADWSRLLTMGRGTELSYRIDQCFEELLRRKADYTTVVAFYFGFMNMMFEWLEEHSLKITELFQANEWESGHTAMKSLPRLQAWVHQICDIIAGYSSHNGRAVSQTVEKVQHYMKAHLQDDFKRDDAASAVYLNPAYLSRLFRKETGKSLTDYLVELRIAKAKEELAHTQKKISDIAIAVGYSNFSHFSQIFKKATGVTPQDYRKRLNKSGGLAKESE